MGLLCSSVGMSDNSVVYEDSCDVSGNTVGVAGSDTTVCL